MTELDFDELDKAVNDLMASTSSSPGQDSGSSVTQPTESTPAPAVKSSTEPEVTKTEATSVAANSSPAPSLVAPAPPVASRGRYMDVIRPSAATASPSASSSTSREGVQINPPAAGAEETAKELAPQPESVVADQVESSNDSSSDISIDTPAETPAETEPVDGAAEEPIASPFLPDAQVEKRPLGAPVAADSETISEANSVTEPSTANADDSSVEQTPEGETSDLGNSSPIDSLPEELHEDIRAVEADNTHSKYDENDTVAAPEPAVQPEVVSEIPQQYTEQPSTGDQTNGAIYDTANYHQALTGTTVKKKPSALKWILWVAILLVVGATGGAAWFYFTTQ